MPASAVISRLRGERRSFDLVLALPGTDQEDVAGVPALLNPGAALVCLVPQEAKDPASSLKGAGHLEAATGLRLQAALVYAWSVEVDGVRRGKYRQNRSTRYPDSVHAHVLIFSRNHEVEVSLEATSVLYEPFGKELPPTWIEGENPEWVRAKQAGNLGAPSNKLSVMGDAGAIRHNGEPAGAGRLYDAVSVRRWVHYKAEGLAEITRGARGYPWSLYERLIGLLPGRRSALVLNDGRGDAVLAAARLEVDVVSAGLRASEKDRIARILAIMS